MDLLIKRPTGAPGLDFNVFMVTHVCRESDETVAFNSVTRPPVDTVYSQEQVGPVVHVIFLGQKLEVQREAEVAHILSALNAVLIVSQFYSGFALLCARVTVVELSPFISHMADIFVIILLLERPSLWHHYLVLDVCRFRQEPNSGHNLT